MGNEHAVSMRDGAHDGPGPIRTFFGKLNGDLRHSGGEISSSIANILNLFYKFYGVSVNFKLWRDRYLVWCSKIRFEGGVSID